MAEPGEITLTGAPAAPGLALGPVFMPGRTRETPARAVGSPDDEAAALRAALETAATDLRALIAASDALGAEILEFQEALIEDDDLTGPVFEAIAAGARADAAWMAALDGEIAEYRAAEDDYMAARAADLTDLRDRVHTALCGAPDASAPPEGAVILAEDLAPSAFLALDWSRLGGAALGGGSPTSHTAILARARGVPMATGLGALPACAPGDLAALDGDKGAVTLRPGEAARAAFAARLARAATARAANDEAAHAPAVTADGRAIRVLINVDDPAMLDGLDPAICDGVGLTRTEFLFEAGAPDEAAQLDAYTRILRWAAGRPVTIRTLDAGGDKPVPGLTEPECNPFLGLRGLRLSLAKPTIFRTQLRALARAATEGPLKIMLPMVTTPAELEAARAHLDAACAALAAEGLAHARPALGIMVETPAAALCAERFDADFYSIGSNDLTQYVCAAARDSAAVADLADPTNPAVLECLRRTVEAGRARGVEVSLCGDMASRPDLADTLIGLGLETLSVAPALVGAVKRAIGKVGAP